MNYHEVAQRSLASQDKAELEQLLTEVGKIEPKVILEIGVHFGRSMRVWDDAFKPTWMYGLEKDTCYDYTTVPGKVLSGVDSTDPDTLNRIRGALNGTEIDFLFIDGDHHYHAVKQDFLRYGALVRPGGLVALHDIRIQDNFACEVYKFWQELKEQGYKWQEFLSPTGTGTGLIWV